MSKQRILPQYDLKELEIMQIESNILCDQIKLKSLKKINIIWDNQSKCAEEINKTFQDRKIINILVYGKTQTGKTGCMTALIQFYVLSNTIPIENIYIITGLSDKAWKNDTKNRMPDCLNNRVYHRANLLKKFADDIKDKQNLLIIMDEIQIASEDKQTIFKTFEKSGFYDLDYLLNNDIKIVQFSATPDGHIIDINNWNKYSKIIQLEPGEGYLSSIDLYNNRRIEQYEDLNGWNEDTKSVSKKTLQHINEIKKCVDKYLEPLYHIIRIPNCTNQKDYKVIDNIKYVFNENENYNFNESLLDNIKKDINDILCIKPEKHTFLFIKEILRCAKTMEKKYLGIAYERYSKTIQDSTIIQGLIGRLTGYDDNGKSICYTNIDTIQRYELLWLSKFKNQKIEWNSKTTTKINGDTYSSNNTFNSTKHVNGLLNKNVVPSDPYKNCKNIPVIIYFDKKLIERIEHCKNNEKKNLLLNIIQKEDLLFYDKIKNYNVEQQTIPKSENSYKKHIIDVVNKANKKEKFSIDIKNKEKNILNIYIDYKKYRLCCIIWDGENKLKQQSGESPNKNYTINGNNYIKQKVPGDGHCFFHAVALYLERDVEELRDKVATYMLDNRDDFINHYEADEHNGITYEEFVELIRSTNEWADNLVIQAIQQVIERPVQVYQYNNGELIQTQDTTIDNENEPIMVLYNGTNHYDALIQLEDDSSELELTDGSDLDNDDSNNDDSNNDSNNEDSDTLDDFQSKLDSLPKNKKKPYQEILDKYYIKYTKRDTIEKLKELILKNKEEKNIQIE